MTAIFIVALLGAAWYACQVEVEVAHQTRPDGWRRGRDGWERGESWQPTQPLTAPQIHPAVVGLFELLVSIWALLLLAPARQTSGHSTGSDRPPATFDLMRPVE